MKTWIQVCAVIMLAGQMSACGGGNGTGPGADANTSVQTAPSAQLTAPSVEQASPAQVKAITETYNAALNLWANTAPANYHYSYKEGGQGYKFDAYSPVTIWVREGKISQVISGVQVLSAEDYQHASIEQIFARMVYTISHSATGTQFFMEFDPLLGFPSSFKVTPSCCGAATQLLVTDLTIDP